MRVASSPGLLAAMLLVACQSHGEAVRVFAPRCPGLPDLEPALGKQIAVIDRSLVERGLGVVALDEPSADAFRDAVRAPRDGWLFALFTGHGTRQGAPSSRVCTGAEPALAGKAARPALLSVNDDILKNVPGTLGGATLVVDACESADVDPRQAPIPVSVISSSPYSVGTDSLFGDRLASALAAAATDLNCDGLVTDQEVFDELFGSLRAEASSASERAFPKLRRNATSHLPLPIRAQSKPECAAVKQQMSELARRTEPQWTELSRALALQLKLDPWSKTDLPSTHCDYFVIADGDASDRKAISGLATEAGLCPFPGGDAELARAVASFAIFAEVFSFSVGCPGADGSDPNDRWVQVSRLRDDALVTVQELRSLGAAIPTRKMLSVRHVLPLDPTAEERRECVVRYTRTAPIAQERPVPCGEPEGQCFQVPCEGLLAKE